MRRRTGNNRRGGSVNPTDQHQAQTFSTPSPGEILRRQSRRAKPNKARAATGAKIAASAFNGGQRLVATRERGVVLAPIIVEWTYRVASPEAFSKWLRTKEILLSDARFGVCSETSGLHYFGTYLRAEDGTDPQAQGVASQTIWGFTGREAFDHFFALGKGDVTRLSIVETDLKDFLSGLRGFVREFDASSFRQSVLVSPQAE
jgi:hypothetical protein